MTSFQTKIVLTFFALTIRAFPEERPRINSAVWLEKGCLALSYIAREGNWLPGEEVAGMQVQVWLNGYIVGVNSMCFSVDPSPPITYPPDEWTDGRRIAPMILEFMKKNPKIPPTAKARSVVTAWYLSSHPKATPEHKRLSKVIVEDLIKNPDRDK